MVFECSKKEYPKWWAAAVFLAPVTTPYFIFKSRRSQGVGLFMIFLVTFIGVSAFEVYTYGKMKETNKYARIPPITRQVMQLSEELKQSTLELDNALVTLEQISKVESRLKELKETIAFIGTLRTLMDKNQAAIARLVKFISDYKAYFVKKDVQWVYQIQLFYTNRDVVVHYTSLETYLEDFEALLTYTVANFYNIKEAKIKEILNNYDEYYLRYRRAVDAHNRFNVKRIEFQNEFLHKYPDVKPYLPGERQTEAFKLWE
jgi:hypothetical protein